MGYIVVILHIEEFNGGNMEERRKEQTRVRMNYKLTAKGIFTPDITVEGETVETAIKLLNEATAEMNKFAKANGFNTEY